jgi:arsenate reductase
MQEIGINISENQTKNVFEFFEQEKHFEHVFTVCDEASGEKCPFFPGIVARIHWSFSDPAGFEGTYEEKMANVRMVRDSIKNKIEEFVVE